MTNREKLLKLFPYIESVGTVLIHKDTEQLLAYANFSWLNAEYKEPTKRGGRMTREEAMIHTLVKENDELKMEIGRLRQAIEQEHKEVNAIIHNAMFDYAGSERVYAALARVRKQIKEVQK